VDKKTYGFSPERARKYDLDIVKALPGYLSFGKTLNLLGLCFTTHYLSQKQMVQSEVQLLVVLEKTQIQ
jgi:hypothetical protein